MHQGNTTFNTREIEIHIRTYRSLLKSAGELNISQIIGSHVGMDSLLHEKAASPKIDLAAFIYVLLRLPPCMSQVKTVVLGQSYDVFEKKGFGETDKWTEVEAPGRRRKMYFDQRSTLNVYISSVSDLDDIITLLTAFQIEWNKFHILLKKVKDVEKKASDFLDKEDIEKIKKIWGEDYHKFLTAIKYREIDFTIKLISGSYVEYAKSTQEWWKHIVNKLSDLNIEKRPIYFVSSNTHSLVNIVTRFVKDEKAVLLDFLKSQNDPNLLRLWSDIISGKNPAYEENFLCYISKKVAKIDPHFEKRRLAKAKKMGVWDIPPQHYLDIDTQVIELSKLSDTQLDPRLEISTGNLKDNRSLIVNIDYPLGWAAYQILTEIGQNTSNIKGIYIMGKAATLNGKIGDILIPDTVFDQHTKNIFVINNAFKREDFGEIFKTGQVLERQKTVSVKGTFMESEALLKSWFREGYTDLEMESGPYLNAVFEFVNYNRYEEKQFVNLTNTPFELGIAHYASDTPYSKAKNMGVRNLSYEGVEPTYAISLAIIKKIIQRELKS